MNAVLEQQQVGLRYTVPRVSPGWELPEETLPESYWHDQVVTLLKSILESWAARDGSRLVVRNMAIRWDRERPGVGVDPDVAVFEPAPPRPRELTSVLLWEEGQRPPVLAIEVVSQSNPRKDDAVAPEKHAAAGTSELWVFDPLLSGPASHGGPFRLQVWTRDAQGTFVRVFAGEGPVESAALKAYLLVLDGGMTLRIADEPGGGGLWLTAEEAERAAKEGERAAKEAERARTEAAQARIAELEAELARLRR